MMDGIYEHRPASLRREGGIDTATSLLESTMEPPGKRRRGQQDFFVALAEMQAADEKRQEWLEKIEDHRDRRFEFMMEDAREARRHEADITRQHMEQSAILNQAFTQLVQALSRPNSVP
ncbi:uncharacterized protein AB9W97_010164 [Spinachia spinachia]